MHYLCLNVFRATFTVGLILIVICGGELATGNFGIIFPAFLNKKVSLMKMLKAWTVVYFSNILGCVLAAFFLAYSSDLYAQDPYLKAVIGIAEAKTSGKTFFQMFCLGLGANWLVNLACYMATAGKTITCKIIAMWFPIMVYGFCLIVLIFTSRHSLLLDLSTALLTLSLYLLA